MTNKLTVLAIKGFFGMHGFDMVFQSGFGIGFVATSFTLEPFDIQVLHFVMELQAFFSCENSTTFITWEFPILLEMNTVLVTFKVMNCVPWTFDHSCTNVTDSVG